MCFWLDSLSLFYLFRYLFILDILFLSGYVYCFRLSEFFIREPRERVSCREQNVIEQYYFGSVREFVRRTHQ